MKSKVVSRFTLYFSLLGCLILVTGQGCSSPGVQDSPEAQMRLQWFEQHQAMQAESPFNSLRWQFVGPVRMNGRITDVAAAPSLTGTIYIASASGGVFKTTDDGDSWTPIFENYPTASIGDIALAPSDPSIVWVGTGEANILRSSMAGTGIYKSTDAGESFSYMGLADTHHISRICVHPTKPNIVYAASAGHEYNFSEDRGVYKTTNGGKTWQKVFFIDEKTAVIDLAMDPEDPDILYAGTAQRLRFRWNDPKEGPQSGIHKTVDGGKTWNPLTNGLPDFSRGECERIGLDICKSQPNVVYTVINKSGAYICRSDDKGETWTPIEDNESIKRVFPGYGWFFGQVRVDPVDPDVIYIMGLNFMRSNDGGKTWEHLKGNHSDYHAMWIDPEDTGHILVGNDGGMMISHDRLATFKHPENIPIAQLYNAGVSMAAGKFMIYSACQDNGAWMGEVDMTAGRTNIQRQRWESAPGDESGRHAVDPTNPNLLYWVNRYGGGPNKIDVNEIEPGQRRIRGTGIAPDFGEDKKRAQWVSPIIVSRYDPNRILYGAQFVFLSDDQGETWKRISPDLTNYAPEKQGNIAYATVFSIAESPLKKGLIYAGTDDGNIQVTRDEGETWDNVSAGLPPDHNISSVEASGFDEGTVYITVNGKRNDDFNIYLFKSTDYGRTWTNIASNIPGSNANVVKEDPENQNILYVGTDRAVYVTRNGGESWDVLGSGLPTVYVHDIVIQTAEDVAVIATHGRGAWVLDILPVRNAVE